ncbi:hypothetical protein CONLIGDRAFT_619866 [Coniochaeta ligniaria NRRL 30616]|uniref:Autophagy-related protein 28 n=1 Tax=Coniochaeta ligniaria NRRL 30616 TaxID=1408157 RepID=A0A1J7IKP9_9PEZI|nr:hypothetical protein CONLIGDRAFT_619866 [Coniochaeta ligniaria NRRL 30616]
MTSKSSFLPRLSLSRGDAPVLPFHNPSSPPLRQKPSEYDLSELSPRPDDALLPSSPSQSYRRSSSPSARYSDHASSAGSESKPKSRILFAGPPPPIATSALLYRDEEDTASSRHVSHRPHHGTTASFARNALTSVGSVLFERASSAASSSHTSRAVDRQSYEPDTVWRNLQQRERALQKELQHLLDVQSAGLSASLDPTMRTTPGASNPLPGSRSDVSDAGTATPTGGGASLSSTSSRQIPEYEQIVVPVRQPQRRPMGLVTARTALARNMSVLADLKSEEEAVLTAAIAARKKALAQLKRLAGRRAGIVSELKALESDGQEPLGQELMELGRERSAVSREIVELEERLLGLRSRQRWLDARIEDVNNRREAGLSGYRNALKEVDANVSTLLKRPPVKPLDLEAVRPPKRDEEGNEIAGAMGQSPGGVEFLRLRPERRTINMARDWWEGEIRILEDRKGDVDKDRTALEGGVRVWQEAIKLVSDFEARLGNVMKGTFHDEGKGKNKEPTPEEAMHAQLDRMAEVITGLERLLLKAEDRSWNLLICAIGAELEAFKQAEQLLRDALRAAGFGGEDYDANDDEGLTPQLGRSMSAKGSPIKQDGPPRKDDLVDLHDEHDDTATTESDNEVPPDLLVAHEEEQDASPVLNRSSVSRRDEQEDTENEVPREFLAEHAGNGEAE